MRLHQFAADENTVLAVVGGAFAILILVGFVLYSVASEARRNELRIRRLAEPPPQDPPRPTTTSSLPPPTYWFGAGFYAWLGVGVASVILSIVAGILLAIWRAANG